MVYYIKGDSIVSDNIKWGKIKSILFLSYMLLAAELKYWFTKLEVTGLIWMIKKICHIVASTT